MKIFIAVCAFFCLSGTALSVQATDQSGGDEQMEMERIGVKAKREKLSAYSHYETTESAKISTEIIDSEEIKDINPVNFYDLISRAAGVDESFQGRKIMNFTSVRRGGGMGMVIDGLYIPSNQASRILAQFPMDAIESVRVVRDSTSLSLGPVKAFASFASAPNEGFVLITTKKGYRPEVGGVAEYGALNTREFQLYHGNRIGNFNYRLTGTTLGTSGKTAWYNDSNSQSLLFNGGYDGPRLKVSTMLFYSDGKRHFQIADGTSPTSTSIPHWGYDPLEGLWFALNGSMLWTPTQITSLTFGYGHVEDTEWTSTYNGRTGVETRRFSYQRDSSSNYHLWHTAIFGNNIVKAGGQLTWWHEPTGYAAYDGKEREETLVGGYLQDEYKFMGGRLTVDGGFRVDATYIKKGIDKYSPTQGTNKIISDVWSEPVYGASIGSAYRLNDTYIFSGRIGFTYAGLDSYLATVGNKDLPAEERFKYEVGATANYHPAFNPTLTLFYYDIKNSKKSVQSIVVTPTYSYNVYDAFNEGLYGGEVCIIGAIPYGFNYKVNYSHNESTINSNNDSNPKDSLSFLVGHTYGPLRTNVSMRYVAGYDENTDSPKGNLVKLDANISYLFQIKMMSGRIMLYGRNLLNDHYVTTKNYSDVGFTYGVRLEANL